MPTLSDSVRPAIGMLTRKVLEKTGRWEALWKRTNTTAGTVSDVANAVKKAIPTAEIKLQPGKGPRYKPDQYLDISRANQDVGYTQEYPIERAVEDYIDWLRKNPV